MRKAAFLTGATGFLGSWLLDELLKSDSYEYIYVLARGSSVASASKRVLRALDIIPGSKYQNYLAKLKIMEGDITLKNLGLNSKDVSLIQKNVTDYFHSAALAEFNVPHNRIADINVGGTKNLIQLIVKKKKDEKRSVINFHFVSTVAIAGQHRGTFRESQFDLKQLFNNSYERSKFEAEKLVRSNLPPGFILKIYRPSIVTGESVSGVTPNFKMFYQPLHFLRHSLFSSLPADRNSIYSFVPVDQVAKAILILSSMDEGKNATHHLVNPDYVSFGDFVSTAKRVFNFKSPTLIPRHRFHKSNLTSAQWRLIQPFIPYLNYKLRFEASRTQFLLNQKGFRWSPMNGKVLTTLFQYCKKTNFNTSSII